MSKENLRYKVEDLILERVNQAQPSAVYPDLPEEWTCSITSATEAKKVLFWILQLPEEEKVPWLTEKVYRVIGYRAFINNYLGEWEVVQAMLETKPQTYETVKMKYLEYHSPEDFYGNYAKISSLWIQGYLWRIPYQRVKCNRVRIPQRKRGYTDKGSCRLPHEYHGLPPYKEKIDRRMKINHPLIREEENDFQNEEVTSTTSWKGG